MQYSVFMKENGLEWDNSRQTITQGFTLEMTNSEKNGMILILRQDIAWPRATMLGLTESYQSDF